VFELEGAVLSESAEKPPRLRLLETKKAIAPTTTATPIAIPTTAPVLVPVFEDLLGLAPHPKLALHSLPDAVKIEGLPNAFTIMFVIVSDDPVLSVSTTDEHENGTDCTQLCNWSSLAGASP